MTIKTKLASGITLAAFLAVVIAPAGAFAGTSVTISGNGKDSTNKVMVKNSKKTMIAQKNSSMVMNKVGIEQNTGGNKANNNTGAGIVSVTSGKATATVTNNTTTGGNYAMLNECGCEPADQTLSIKNNGADSENGIHVSGCESTYVAQMNMAWVVNEVGVSQNTGMNSASGNTSESGDGDPSVVSGNAKATVTSDTVTGDNVLGPVMAE